MPHIPCVICRDGVIYNQEEANPRPLCGECEWFNPAPIVDAALAFVGYQPEEGKTCIRTEIGVTYCFRSCFVRGDWMHFLSASLETWGRAYYIRRSSIVAAWAVEDFEGKES